MATIDNNISSPNSISNNFGGFNRAGGLGKEDQAFTDKLINDIAGNLGKSGISKNDLAGLSLEDLIALKQKMDGSSGAQGGGCSGGNCSGGNCPKCGGCAKCMKNMQFN